jgi:hypothetical protein
VHEVAVSLIGRPSASIASAVAEARSPPPATGRGPCTSSTSRTSAAGHAPRPGGSPPRCASSRRSPRWATATRW